MYVFMPSSRAETSHTRAVRHGREGSCMTNITRTPSSNTTHDLTVAHGREVSYMTNTTRTQLYVAEKVHVYYVFTPSSPAETSHKRGQLDMAEMVYI